MNLSSFILNEPQVSLLSKGLSFCPTSKFVYGLTYVNKLARLLTVKNYFADSSTQYIDYQEEITPASVSTATQ